MCDSDRFSEDFKVASTSELVKLLKNKNLKAQQFLEKLTIFIENNKITAHQYSLIQNVVIDSIVTDHE